MPGQWSFRLISALIYTTRDIVRYMDRIRVSLYHERSRGSVQFNSKLGKREGREVNNEIIHFFLLPLVRLLFLSFFQLREMEH